MAVKIDRHRDVSFEVTSREMTLDIRDFSSQLIAPAMRAIAQAVDEDLLNECANIAASVQATADPSDLADLAALAKTLDAAMAPLDQRRLVLSTAHKYRYALTDNLSKVAYAGSGETLRNAELGRVYTLDTYMDQNCPDSLSAAPGTARGLPGDRYGGGDRRGPYGGERRHSHREEGRLLHPGRLPLPLYPGQDRRLRRCGPGGH